MEWAPDGEKILTATTAPRLRIGNGFKVWHYSGALLHETSWPEGQELLQVMWQKYEDNLFKEKPISKAKVQGIEPSQPQSSKAVYVPPNIRSGSFSTPPSRSGPERGPIPGLPIGYKVSQGQRKKDRNSKRKETESSASSASSASVTSRTQHSNNANASTNLATNSVDDMAHPPKRNPRQRIQRPSNHSIGNGSSNHSIKSDSNTNTNNSTINASPSNEQSDADQDKPKRDRRQRNRRKQDGGTDETAAAATPRDPEKEKRIRTVQQKLRDITKLKGRRDNGENLEANQLSKIKMEADLVKELAALKVEA